MASPNESAVTDLPQLTATGASVTDARYHHAFPTVNVPDHAHYTIGAFILAVGITGMVGNFLVIYAFCRSKSLRSPSNIFIINLAISDFLMSVTQAPIFFVASLHKRWIFGEKGAYVPEGLMTSCTWDYTTFTPSVRAYTMLLFCCVFFIPLGIIIYCYVFIFRAILSTNRDVQKIGGNSSKESQKRFQRISNEWKMAKIALIVILLYVISWSPYATVALTSFAGYASVLTPYMNSVPAVIAKASAIHNPIIYAITHPKYRTAIGKYIPFLGCLLRLSPKDYQLASSRLSTRQSTLTSQTSKSSGIPRSKNRMSASESESVDITSINPRPDSRVVSCEFSKDAIEPSDTKEKSTLKINDSGIFEKASSDISMIEVGPRDDCRLSAKVVGNLDGVGPRRVEAALAKAGRIPSIVITHTSSPGSSQTSGASFSPMYETSQRPSLPNQ
ncbi:melanopsin-A isoform X2 [Scyliorhinus torazame]|uniref:melanopsin-A isoform X2 n=1 Tax=Scyliorhinus torazame TaxID=75743 RepID=UPI003B5C2737